MSDYELTVTRRCKLLVGELYKSIIYRFHKIIPLKDFIVQYSLKNIHENESVQAILLHAKWKISLHSLHHGDDGIHTQLSNIGIV